MEGQEIYDGSTQTPSEDPLELPPVDPEMPLFQESSAHPHGDGDGGVPENVLPCSVEYDPDSKPTSESAQFAATTREAGQRSHRLHMCFGAILTALCAGAVVVAVVLIKNQQSTSQVVPTPPTNPQNISQRDSLGIRPMIEAVVGADRLQDSNSPYAKALNWILYDDPIQLTPNNNSFYQRYFAATFYQATSVDKPWSSCSPPADKNQSYCTDYRLTHSWFIWDKMIFLEELSSSWLSGTSECVWAGVFCDFNGQIRSLSLSGMNLTGTFPDVVQFFPYLQNFDAMWGTLRGTLPKLVASMKSLKSLYLGYNQLTGTIPTELWLMRSLFEYDLGANSFTGNLSSYLSQMVDTKSVALNNNELSGTIPTEMALLKSCTNMWLAGNRLNGTIPTELGSYFALRSLRLSNNLLTGTIPSELGQMTFVGETISLSTNDLIGPIPDEIFNVPLLNTLELDNNRLTGSVSSHIGNLTLLTILDLQNNMMNGTIPEEFSFVFKDGLVLEARFNGNNFTGTMPASVCTNQVNFPADLVVDCYPDERTGKVEIECPWSCCNQCCDPSGFHCYTEGQGT